MNQTSNEKPVVVNEPNPDEGAGQSNLAPTAAQQRIIDLTIRLGVLAILVFWCFIIVEPFILMIIWGIIIAVAVQPLHLRITNRLGGRPKTAAILVSLMMLAILIVPTVFLSKSMVQGVDYVTDYVKTGTLAIPPPPESVSEWPVVGDVVHDYWTDASRDIGQTLVAFKSQLAAIGEWVLNTAAGTGFALLQFIVAIVIAGALLTSATAGSRVAEQVSRRIAGPRGEEYVRLASETVRNVARGIIGVALIQAIASGIGFVAADVPLAGLLALICLITATIQLGTWLVAWPAIFYVFATADTVTAVIFLVWNLMIMASDNILKPLLLGRGARVPMLVIFIGAIGGFISSGIIGLFIGAVVLSIGYTLYEAWVSSGGLMNPLAEEDAQDKTPSGESSSA